MLYARGVLRAAAMASLVAALASGCGAAGARYAYPEATTAAQAPAGDYAGGGQDDYRGEPAPAEQPRFAQAGAEGGGEVTTDATSAPLLVYDAHLGLAVHQVSAKQDRVEAIAREAGGFLASRTDDTIIIRVPARAFDRAMAEVQALGDVLTRRVDVQDVTEEFRDIETRIQTLEAMRRRVQQLLERATDVQAALAVEQHLERITVELERLRGRLRFLADRVSFSTITVRFQERAETSEPEFQLPFPWLQQLGLQRLLRL